MKKFIIKNKKAILMPEALKMIIAVICIALLIMLAIKIYDIFSKQRELEKAKFSLKSITDKIRFMETKNINKDKILVLKFGSKENWALAYYNEKTYSSKDDWTYDLGYLYDVSPLNTCTKNCLCLCPIRIEYGKEKPLSIIYKNVACSSGACEYLPNIEINEPLPDELYKGIEIELMDLGIEKNLETNKFTLKKLEE